MWDPLRRAPRGPRLGRILGTRHGTAWRRDVAPHTTHRSDGIDLDATGDREPHAGELAGVEQRLDHVAALSLLVKTVVHPDERDTELYLLAGPLDTIGHSRSGRPSPSYRQSPGPSTYTNVE